jgi:hypothetical protein
MRPDETDINSTELLDDYDHQSIVIAFDVKYNAIVGKKLALR